jgi:cytochrome o ubiquinol oxidase operon protein cyoD
MEQNTLTIRVVGFISCLLLTLAAFWIVFTPAAFHLNTQGVIIAIFSLALMQFVVQSICFLKLFEEKGPRWHLVVFLSTLSIILIIILGSIWIMRHLDCHMMM